MNSTLLKQEHRSTKLFLFLFYISIICYDAFYYYIIPKYILFYEWSGLPDSGLGFWIYFIYFCLLPIAFYYFQKDNPYVIKYIYFFIYTLITFTNDIMIFFQSNLSYESGNVVELVLILFSPIFVNKRFFWIVSIGTMTKYIILGIILLEPQVLIPIALVVVFAIVAYILLNRFLGYISAMNLSYDKQLEGIVRGVVATLELKDPYTRGHSERVAKYAMYIAKELGLSDQELQSFYYACLLHDVGKVHIPDHILMKPSRLTEEEYEVIKTHPVVGAEAIGDIEILQENIDVIKHHHERWDGKGYPSGYKGDEIPLLARITAIADAFDAMTSFRSYRKAMPFETAYQNIMNGKGTQFDPELVEVFKRVYPSWVTISLDYQEKVSNDKPQLSKLISSKEGGEYSENP